MAPFVCINDAPSSTVWKKGVGLAVAAAPDYCVKIRKKCGKGKGRTYKDILPQLPPLCPDKHGHRLLLAPLSTGCGRHCILLCPLCAPLTLLERGDRLHEPPRDLELAREHARRVAVRIQRAEAPY